MGALKWIVVSICGLGGLGVIALGVTSASPARAAARTSVVSPISLRPFPPGPAPTAAPTATVTPPTPEKAAVDAGAPAAEAGTKAAAVVDAGTKVPEPAAAKAVVDAGTKAPEPVAAKAPPAPKAEPAAPVPDGFLDLLASEAADVFIDGRKVGSAPVNGVKVRAGAHKIRFDCYDAAGNTTPGQAQTVQVPSGESAEVNFKCPAAE